MLFQSLLIANRGEIACRIIKTAKRLGIPTAAVYSTADKNSLHVKTADQAVEIGPARAAESYLSVDKIIAAALKTGSDAIHPGYGFLSENSALAKACRENSIEFIGPPAEVIETMASKSTASKIAEKARVPVLSGFREFGSGDAGMVQAATEIGYPVLLKSALGGGGRGMRIVRKPCDLLDNLAAARSESLESFGDDRIIIEKYLRHARHIEVQVIADKHQNATHLFDRDCSVQRRYQKIIEEAPSPNIGRAIKEKMYAAAVALTKALNYYSVGTIEFLFAGDAFYFIEMNTRLQVEHPVTEQITGCDLVEWQLRIASGESIEGLKPPKEPRGHSIETRIYAEDPRKNFLPSPGLIKHLHFPKSSSNLQIHSGVIEGDEVGRHYDPLIAKLVSSGSNRSAAVSTMLNALIELQIAGLATNTALLVNLLQSEAFLSVKIDTKFVENNFDSLVKTSTEVTPEILILSALYVHSRTFEKLPPDDEFQEFKSPWKSKIGWRVNAQREFSYHFKHADQIANVSLCFTGDSIFSKLNSDSRICHIDSIEEQQITATIDGVQWSIGMLELVDSFAVFHRGSHYELRSVDQLSTADADYGHDGSLLAPLPGRVSRILVNTGDKVKAGQKLVVVEAMKMEHLLISPVDGVITSINCSVDEQVDEGATCVIIEEQVQ